MRTERSRRASLRAITTASRTVLRFFPRPPVADALTDLFATQPTTVIDDVEGGIRYWPGIAGPEEAQRWFEALRDGVAWHSERRRMYERTVDVPRLLAGFAVDRLPDALPLRAILDRVRTFVPADYNAVGLNFYRDGADSVAMHNDKLYSIVSGEPIALVSLGSARRMTLRAKAGDRRGIALELEPGSLLAMSHASQRTHEHGIPKTTRAVGPRISVVFRVRPAGQVKDY